MLEFAKIPAKVSTHDKRQVKTLAVYFALKQFWINGILKDFKRNRAFYAGELNISVSNLRNKEKDLLRYNLARWNGKDLQLVSYGRLWNLFGIKSKRFFKITSTDVKAIENFMYAVAIKQNYRQQKWKMETKIVVSEIQNIKACDQMGIDYNQLINKARNQSRSENAWKKVRKWITNSKNFDNIKDHYQITWYKMKSCTMEQPNVNPIVTLSCSGLARVCLGKKYNPSTGYYLAKRLEFYGMVSIQSDNVRINPGLKKQTVFYEPQGIGTKYRTLANRVNVEF